MQTPDHDAQQQGRLERLAEAHAAEYVDDDIQVRFALKRVFPCPRYLWRSRCDNGTTRLELADTTKGAQWAMAAFAQDCPAWWPASDPLDLDTGAELDVWPDASARKAGREANERGEDAETAYCQGCGRDFGYEDLDETALLCEGCVEAQGLFRAAQEATS